MKDRTLTVSQLNEYVRRTLASDPMLQNICLKGEVSNLKRHSSGHWYFTLKDMDAAINCAMFRQRVLTLRFRPENGQQVRVLGSVGLYGKTGSYQFYVDAMEPDGLGDLYLQFETLKQKLGNEGLFQQTHKKELPLLPACIGIVTSKTGAVVHDIARVAWRRYPGMPLLLCPVKVQGESAAQEIVRAIQTLDAIDSVDVIIVGRGGGSMEDLWAFNEEPVARAIFACSKPVVSAVGHETDFTIADFVADLRAPTPSAAAELVVPEKTELQQDLALLTDRLHHAAQQAVSEKRLQLTSLQNRLFALSPAQRTERMKAALESATIKMHSLFQASLTQKRHRLEQAALRLRTSGPQETMKRGYAVVLKKNSLVRSTADVQPHDALTIVMTDGIIQAEVDAIKSKEGDLNAC